MIIEPSTTKVSSSIMPTKASPGTFQWILIGFLVGMSAVLVLIITALALLICYTRKLKLSSKQYCSKLNDGNLTYPCESDGEGQNSGNRSSLQTHLILINGKKLIQKKPRAKDNVIPIDEQHRLSSVIVHSDDDYEYHQAGGDSSQAFSETKDTIEAKKMKEEIALKENKIKSAVTPKTIVSCKPKNDMEPVIAEKACDMHEEPVVGILPEGIPRSSRDSTAAIENTRDTASRTSAVAVHSTGGKKRLPKINVSAPALNWSVSPKPEKWSLKPTTTKSHDRTPPLEMSSISTVPTTKESKSSEASKLKQACSPKLDIQNPKPSSVLSITPEVKKKAKTLSALWNTSHGVEVAPSLNMEISKKPYSAKQSKHERPRSEICSPKSSTKFLGKNSSSSDSTNRNDGLKEKIKNAPSIEERKKNILLAGLKVLPGESSVHVQPKCQKHEEENDKKSRGKFGREIPSGGTEPEDSRKSPPAKDTKSKAALNVANGSELKSDKKSSKHLPVLKKPSKQQTSKSASSVNPNSKSAKHLQDELKNKIKDIAYHCSKLTGDDDEERGDGYVPVDIPANCSSSNIALEPNLAHTASNNFDHRSGENESTGVSGSVGTGNEGSSSAPAASSTPEAYDVVLHSNLAYEFDEVDRDAKGSAEAKITDISHSKPSTLDEENAYEYIQFIP